MVIIPSPLNIIITIFCDGVGAAEVVLIRFARSVLSRPPRTPLPNVHLRFDGIEYDLFSRRVRAFFPQPI